MSHEELAERYDAVVYAVGSQTDRRLGIPGEDLPGSWAATELVAWYNGHPDFQQLSFDLEGVERAVVVGNGNVALDVARMLALTEEELAPTDTTDQAIEAIVGSGIREIVVLGRRGPVQAAWTSTELGEMGDLAGANIVVDPDELVLEPASEAELAASSNLVRRNVEILRDFAGRGPEGKPRSVRLRFRVSPVAVLGEDRVEGVEIVRNRLEAEGDGQVRAVATEEREVIPCQLVFRSVGYRGVSLPGVPFDEWNGTIPNATGRVLDEHGEPVPRPLRRRLDQARADRRHRHEQEGRRRDRRAPARGRAGRRAARAVGGLQPRGAARGARRARRHVRGLGVDRRARALARRSRMAARGSSSVPGTSCSQLRGLALTPDLRRLKGQAL